MTDDPADTGDSTDPVVTVDPAPDPTPDPLPAPDGPPMISVVRQGEWRIIAQQQANGSTASIYLDPDQAKAVGWALLSPDEATQDIVTDPNTVNVAGRFT